MTNLFDDLPRHADVELFSELFSGKSVRIERIVSTGQFTPVDKPYDQEQDEWVLLVAGSAGLWIEGEGNAIFVRATMFLSPLTVCIV